MIYYPSVTSQVCHRCRRMHVRGTGDRTPVITVCPDCDRSRPVYWCDECDKQITGDVYGEEGRRVCAECAEQEDN